MLKCPLKFLLLQVNPPDAVEDLPFAPTFTDFLDSCQRLPEFLQGLVWVSLTPQFLCFAHETINTRQPTQPSIDSRTHEQQHCQKPGLSGYRCVCLHAASFAESAPGRPAT